jgi:hypothetical protein
MVKSAAEGNDATVAREFYVRVIGVKNERELASWSGLISGLLDEKLGWRFVCSEHLSVRFKEESELRAHFEKEKHSGRPSRQA